jgi:hypothetical protein
VILIFLLLPVKKGSHGDHTDRHEIQPIEMSLVAQGGQPGTGSQ